MTMKSSYYTLSTQMSVILKDNFRRKNLFDLYGIKHGPNDVSTMAEACNAYGVDLELFLHLCNIFTFNNYILEDHITGEFPVDPAIDYTIKANDYFLDIIMTQVKVDFDEINSIRNDRVFTELFDASLDAMNEHISNCHKVFALYLNRRKPVASQQIKHVIDLEVKACQSLEILIKYMMEMQLQEEYRAKAEYLRYFLIILRRDFDKTRMITTAIFKRITGN